MKVEKKYLQAVAITWFVVLFTTIIYGLWITRNRLNPDGLVYALQAERIAQGHFFQSVTSYWSPLISWFASPLIFLGADPLYSVKIITALSALLLTFGYWKFSQRFISSTLVRVLGLLSVSIASIVWTTTVISPDLLLCAILVWYLWLVSDPEHQTKKKTLLIGMLGGLAYLCKAYALPFFLVHYTMTCLVLKTSDLSNRVSGSSKLKQFLKVWLIGIAGFLIVALPWIGMISYKYSAFELGSSGRINHAMLAPGHFPSVHPVLTALREPGVDDFTAWEDPATLSYPTWPRMTFSETVSHYWSIVKYNFPLIFSFLHYDRLHFSQFAIALTLVFAFWPFGARRLHWWIFLSLLIFILGYLPVMTFGDQRYFWIVLVMSSLVLYSVPQYFVKNLYLFYLILFVIFLSYSYQGFRDLRYLFFFTRPGIEYHSLAKKSSSTVLSNIDRVASDDWKQGLYLTYYFRDKAVYLGTPASTNVSETREQLLTHRIDTILTFGDSLLRRQVSSLSDWQVYKKIRLGEAGQDATELVVYKKSF